MAVPRAVGPVAAVTPQRTIKPAAVAPAREAAYVPRRRNAATPGMGTRADLSIGFEFGSDRMTEAGLATAKVFQQSLQMPQMAGKRFVIEGHTDSTGDAARNLDLSRRRAQAVADFLKSNGVDGARLEVKGIGSQNPLPGRRSSDPANRRVEAALIS